MNWLWRPDPCKSLLKEALREVLEAEMTELPGAEPSERTRERRGYRAGYYHRGVVTRIGKRLGVHDLQHQ